ncbi:MAG: tripartite tricarboxylate transporter substrate binding protein [Betaproteobacteria bacterium]|nr:tripartite tricarboxylate transporter substrate binding protein [Betaproteobacteria bacterium]
MIRINLRSTIAIALLASFAKVAPAQSYPAKPVRIVVGYVAGGSVDLVGRSLGQKLSQNMGQAFVVENRPGASATLAASTVAKSPADGYTLLLGDTAPLVIAPFTNKNLAYDTLRDFTPISLIYAATGMALVSNAGTSIKTFQDLVREAKTNPGKLSYGSSGIASIHHLAMEVLKADVGMDIVHIPYKGSGQSIVAALSGEIHLLYSAITTVIPHIASGKVNLLAVGSPARQANYPNSPTLAELVKDFDVTGEFGVLGPAGLPQEVLVRLATAIRQAAESAELIDKFKDSGGVIISNTPLEYAEHIRRNLRKFERAVKLAKIEPN